MLSELPKINDWLDGKNIFITGVTGFLGKVLLEKLIRCVPTINRIYVLIRSKKEKSIEERLNDLTKFEIFDIINERHPNWLDKVTPIEGDCSEIKLGMSEINWNILKENVSVIFHAAASIRFDDPLKKAILLNVRGTREVSQLALEMKKVEVFVHVSTTYCNNHHSVVEEKLYPPLGDWKEDIKIATEMDEYVLNVITKPFTHFQVNTYTYTKGVAENLIYDMCNEKVPAIIVRPCIVISTHEDPFPGWLDNFNGIGGLMLVTAKGINRVQMADENITADFIPVDILIKMLIISACWKATAKTKHLEVINASDPELYSVTGVTILETCLDIAKYLSMKNQLWYPTIILTKRPFIYTMLFYILQLIPSILVDGIIFLVLKKTLLVRIQRKIYTALTSLQYFQLNKWTFTHDKMLEITKSINPADDKHFHVEDKKIEHKQFIYNALVGAKKYLLKEPIEDRENYFNYMFYVHNVTVYAFYALLCWIAYIILLPMVGDIFD